MSALSWVRAYITYLVYFASNLSEFALWTMGYILSNWLCKEQFFHWYVEVQFKPQLSWVTLGCRFIFHSPSWLFVIYSTYFTSSFCLARSHVKASIRKSLNLKQVYYLLLLSDWCFHIPFFVWLAAAVRFWWSFLVLEAKETPVSSSEVQPMWSLFPRSQYSEKPLVFSLEIITNTGEKNVPCVAITLQWSHIV